MYVAVIWYVGRPESMSVFGPYSSEDDAEQAAKELSTMGPSKTQFLTRKLTH